VAEVSPFTAKSQEMLYAAGIAAIEIFLLDLLNNRTKISLLFCEFFSWLSGPPDD